MKFSELHRVKRILRKLFPSAFPVTEYVASSTEGLPCMLKCVAVAEGKRIELPQQPLFLGYKPLVMGVCELPERIQTLADAGTVVLEYLNTVSGKKVASLTLRVDKAIRIESKLLVLLVGTHGEHQLESFWDRLAFRLNVLLTKKHAGNIDLTPSEYDQLKIAYSIPRPIRMLHVYKGEKGNAFPIDLFGWIGMAHFVLSVRHEKKSAQQIMIADKIETIAVRSAHSAAAYAAGRFHSADMVSPTPAQAPYYNVDLYVDEIIGDYGVHRLFLFRTGPHLQIPAHQRDDLVHVHRSYASWHKRQGFPLKEIPH
jgi:hypothetical protein